MTFLPTRTSAVHRARRDGRPTLPHRAPVAATIAAMSLSASAAVSAPADPSAGVAALPFLANQGRYAAGDVAFHARSFGGTLFVRPDGGLVWALPAPGGGGWAFAERWERDAAAAPAPRGREPVSVAVHDLRAGTRPAAAAVPAYAALDLGPLAPGVRGELRAQGGTIEKRFHLAPGIDASAIRVAVDGVDALGVDAQGRLALRTPRGAIRFSAPRAWQDVDGRQRPVEVAYRIVDGGHYGFTLGAHDPARAVVIDPLLASTFVGGSNDAYVLGPTADAVLAMLRTSAGVYVAGRTTSIDFPTRLGAFDAYQGGIEDGFVARFSPDLSTLEASTFLGGGAQDYVTALAAGPGGSVYATGYTNGGDFPTTPGAWQGGNGVSGPFVVRLDAALSTLEAAAVLGVGSDTSAQAIAVDTANGGDVVVAGRTSSPALPTTPGAFDRTCGTDGACNPSGTFGIRTSDAFVSRLDAGLATLVGSTYLGSSSDDGAAGVAVDADGSVLVVGQTISHGFPLTPGSLIDHDGGLNLPVAWVSRFAPDLSALRASSLLGGSDGLSDASAVRVAGGRVWIGGLTYASDFPMPAGAFDRSCGSDGLCDPTGAVALHHADGYVIALSPALDTLLAGSYVGGRGDDAVTAIAPAADGSVVVAGRTASDDLPTLGSASWDATRAGGDDAFAMRLDGALQSLLGATYLGAGADDAALAVAVDSAGPDGGLWVAGTTASPAFPVTAGAYDTGYNGGAGDAFVARFDLTLGAGAGDNLPPLALVGDDVEAAPRTRVTLDGGASSDPDGRIVAWQWRQTGGPAVRLRRGESPQALFTAPRVGAGQSVALVFELTVTDDDGAQGRDAVTVTVGR